MSETESNLEAFLFEAAAQKTDAAERAAFLDGAWSRTENWSPLVPKLVSDRTLSTKGSDRVRPEY
jgi:hypothetical protein